MTRIALSLVLLSCLITGQTASAAPSANLLKGRNPSFEQGLTHWFLSTDTDYNIAESPKAPCGKRFLRINETNPAYAQLYSDGVRFKEDGRYRFSIQARVKPTNGGKPLVMDIFAAMIQENGSMGLYSIGHNIRNTGGKWIEYSGTFQTNKSNTPKLGFYIELRSKHGGKIEFDCARIERSN